MVAQDGVPVVLGTSAWTVVDYRERALFRGELGFDQSFHHEEDTLPFCTKILIPRDLEQNPAGSHTVVWSDIDTNGHANNCAYTQWVLDAMPVDYVRNHVVKDVQVNYNHEIHLGEKVDFFMSRAENLWFVTGRTGEKVCFSVRLEFD
jgi:medium-chain acyl-[acyl-carrier-protein] hydrolase